MKGTIETCFNFCEYCECFTRSMIRRQQLEDVAVIILIKVKYKDGRHWVKARGVVMEFLGYCGK